MLLLRSPVAMRLNASQQGGEVCRNVWKPTMTEAPLHLGVLWARGARREIFLSVGLSLSSKYSTSTLSTVHRQRRMGHGQGSMGAVAFWRGSPTQELGAGGCRCACWCWEHESEADD